MWLVVVFTGAIGAIFAMAAGTHVALMAALIPILITVAMLSPKSLLLLLTIWMAELGLIRRLIPGGQSASFSGDPLLIVGPAILFFLVVVAGNRGAFHSRGALAKTVLAFNVLCIFEAVNPAQGGFTVGLGGLLFVLVPMMAFWIGRSFFDDLEAEVLIKVIAWLSLGAAAYGLYQVFGHFPSWDQTWIASSGYTALNVGNGVTRAFGMSASAQEYAAFMGLGLIAWLALYFKANRGAKLLPLSAMAVISYALYYEAQRTILFLTVFAVGVTIAARFRVRPLGVAVCGVVAIFGLIFFAGKFTAGGTAVCHEGDQQCTLSQRSNTIANPTGAGTSFSGHLTETRKGMVAGVVHPLGRGVGSTTLAAGKFNTVRAARGTEFDPGNAGTALGIGGLVLYPTMVVLAFRAAYKVATRRRDFIGIFVIGAMAVDLMQWLNGDLYSVTWLVWLFIGWAEAQSRMPDSEPVEAILPLDPHPHPASFGDEDAPSRKTRWA
ncbi:MAG: hypothetical protein WCL38_03280 [Actinomycetota bacterium]